MTCLLAVLMMSVAADPIDVVLKKDGDKVTVTVKNEQATVSIQSATGIGGATLRPTKEGWPKQLRLELNLKGLEGFSMEAGTMRMRSFLGSEKAEIFQMQDGRWEPTAPSLKVAPAIRKEAGRIIVDVPADFWLHPATKEVSIEWIDFYRR